MTIEKPTFFARRALLILMVVFFLVPFGLRGARLALQGMKNDVKDWLPKEFEETRDLDAFRKHFLSEQFILVSWDGCYGDENDERFRLFVAKLTPELPPSQLKKASDATDPEGISAGESSVSTIALVSHETAEPGPENPTRYIHSTDDFIGDRLGLYSPGDYFPNWGDRNEKWLKGLRLDEPGSNEECWYYITPDGDLFRWDGVDSPFASLARLVYRALVSKEVEGTLVHAFGPEDGRWYHADPRRLRAQLFKTVTTGPGVWNSLTREGGELAGEDAEAYARLEGTLFGPEREGKRTTCVVLTLTDAARRNLHLAVGRGILGKPRGRLYEIAKESNIAEEDLRMGGPPIDNVAIDEEGSITLVRLIGLCMLIGVGLAYLCFRSVTATIMIFFVGGISAVTSLAIVYWSGSSVDAIMMSMPSMVYVLAMSGAAHILNYYREAVDEHGPVGASERAVKKAWKPAFLCELTTALGLISLVTSELVPIRKFGIYSAIAVMVMLGIMFAYLPSALQIWPQKPRKKPVPGQKRVWLENVVNDFWAMVGSLIIRNHAVVAIGCLLIIGSIGYGIVHMRTSVNLLKMFHSEAKIIKDYEWLEANLGPLVPMEVVVRVPQSEQAPSNQEMRDLQLELASEEITFERKAEIEAKLAQSQMKLSFLERMELAARVQKTIEEEFGPHGRAQVGKAISAATFVRPLPKPGGSTTARLTRSSTSGRLEAHKEEFLHSDYLRIEPEDGTELWRVSLRLSATQEHAVDYGEFVSNLQEAVEPVLAAQRERARVLEQLTAASPENEARRLVGTSVLLAGMPAEKVDQKVDPQTPVDQQRLFARSLRDLLTISRLKLSQRMAGEPITDEDLAKQDCVVLVGDVPPAELQRIKQTAPLVVDARDFAFSAATREKTAYQKQPASVCAVYTGVVPIVYKAQRSLLDSLIQSTFWSFITITPLMMWISRSFWGGLVSMLPNVLPVLMVFGGMGWLGIDVDVGAMMTASIALGVAVDDTIHYLNWYREELDRLGDRKLAILAAYKHCATPTLQAATISGIGLSIFALSTFTPTQRFGVLMLVILWMGAIAELIFFPAILAGPLGLVFKPRKRADKRTDDAHPVEPPMLQIVRDEDLASEESTEEAEDQTSPSGPRPHTPKRSGQFGHLRKDAPHRPRES